jgi:outer membrane protein assembly factor BamB
MKRKTVVLALTLLLLFSIFTVIARKPSNIGATSSPGANPVDWWTMFNHDLRHGGYSTSEAPDNNNTLWNYTTGGSVWSIPAVVDGKVFVGSNDNNVYAFG